MSFGARNVLLAKNVFKISSFPRPLSVNFSSTVAEKVKGTEIVQCKGLSTMEKGTQEAEELSKKYHKHVSETIQSWDKCDEIYYGKERDFTNFPTIKIAEQHPKVRLGFIPDSWFQALYSRTGTTGPYLFLGGTTAFLLSKEYWVVDAHFIEILPFIAIMTWGIKKFGTRTSAYIDKLTQQRIDNFYTKPLKNTVANLERMGMSADMEIARAACVPQLIAAKKENVDLQLEAAYRERLQTVYKNVTRRLDYHVERENIRRRFQQHHMADWITSAVVSGISPTQEKETMRKCIDDLKALAAAEKRPNPANAFV